ncbi:MAG TPA: YceI family protein [Steroidobacteraceae bacterium]|nr:YceI family protein [Steroidobacteraceae bacterium]
MGLIRAGLALICLLPCVAAGAVDGYHHMTAANTRVTFEVRRLGMRLFSAEFHQLDGDLQLDPSGQHGTLGVLVNMRSLDCHDSGWNVRLRSPQWLDVEQYPAMVFHSREIHFEGAGRATVQGELTLHGVTRTMVFTFSDIHCNLSDVSSDRVCHFFGRAQIRRSDFKLPHGFWDGGDVVDIVVRGL